MGEGGALLLREEKYIEKGEIIREKGTNRSVFLRGQVDKYTWVSQGSSYLPSELNAAYLWAQLEDPQVIFQSRMKLWDSYYEKLLPLEEEGFLDLPVIPEHCGHNAHMFYLKCKDIQERSQLISYLKDHDIMAVFHYVPLHSAKAGLEYGRFHGEDRFTTKESQRLLRLPLYFGLQEEEIQKITAVISKFMREGA